MTQTQTINKAVRRHSAGRLIAFLYGLVACLVFFVTFLYAIGFVADLVVRKPVDTGAMVDVAEALVVSLS
jgi:hypothetical protein